MNLSNAYLYIDNIQRHTSYQISMMELSLKIVNGLYPLNFFAKILYHRFLTEYLTRPRHEYPLILLLVYSRMIALCSHNKQ